MTVMKWREHLDRSPYLSRMASGCAHVFSWMEPAGTELMFRLDCTACRGTAWVCLKPALDQLAETDDVVEHVERTINERTAQSTQGS
jgi:hypothetical protein